MFTFNTVPLALGRRTAYLRISCPLFLLLPLPVQLPKFHMVSKTLTLAAWVAMSILHSGLQPPRMGARCLKNNENLGSFLRTVRVLFWASQSPRSNNTADHLRECLQYQRL